MMEKLRAAEKLNKEVDRLITKWDERSSFTISGVTNLSRSDLDLIELYTRLIIDGNSPDLVFYGGVKEVLEKRGLYQDSDRRSIFRSY